MEAFSVFTCNVINLFSHYYLTYSRLDPLIKSNPTSGAKQTTVTFARNSEVSLYIVDIKYNACTTNSLFSINTIVFHYIHALLLQMS